MIHVMRNRPERSALDEGAYARAFHVYSVTTRKNGQALRRALIRIIVEDPPNGWRIRFANSLRVERLGGRYGLFSTPEGAFEALGSTYPGKTLEWGETPKLIDRPRG